MNEDQDGQSAAAAGTNKKDEIMAHFQEITDFFDVEQCQAILESTNWNLDQAIQSFFATGGVIENMEETSSNTAQEWDDQLPSAPPLDSSLIHEQIRPQSSSTNNDMFASGTSILAPSYYDSFIRGSTTSRLINFHIEYFQKRFQLHMPDSETILALKQLISDEISVPVKHQKLKGWKNKDTKINDHMLLRELNLPLDNNLFVINTSLNSDNSEEDPTDQAAVTTASGSSGASIESFELNIQIQVKKTNQLTIINQSKSADAVSLANHLATQTFQSAPQKSTTNSYRLQFEPHVKFIEIKRKISMLSNLGVNEQEWWLFINNEEKDPYDFNENESNSDLKILIEAGLLFSMPLTMLIENELNLVEIKQLLDNLTETNTKTATNFTDLNKKPHSNNMKNSKTTPPLSNSCKMSFLVTSKKQELATTPTSSFDNFSSIEPGTSKSIFTKSQENEEAMTKLSSNENDEIIEEDNEFSSHIEIDEEDEDLDDHFIVESTIPKQKALIPSSCPVGDEFNGTTMFVEEFFKRYQPLIPIFSIGTLENAIKEALLCPARERKLLGIYLHSDNSVCRHIFCSKTLCDENVVNFLAANFVVWPWDLTNKEHEAYFYTSCSRYLGSVVTSHLKTNKITFPAFLIVNRTRGNNEVIAVIEGTASSDSMMHRLMQAYEMFEEQRIKDERDERTRDEREQIKREQDAAYQASLELDKAKRQKQDEENERIKQAAQLEEEQKSQKLLEKEMKKKRCLDALPAEPVEGKDAPNSITRIRFRLPDGQMLQRKFFITDDLNCILNFVSSTGYFVDEYKVLSSWPRRDLTSESSEKTIEELKLYPQETLTLEER